MSQNLQKRLRVLQHRALNAVNKRLFPQDVVGNIITLNDAPSMTDFQQHFPQQGLLTDPDVTQYVTGQNDIAMRLVRPPIVTCTLNNWHWHARHGILATPDFDILLESAPIRRRIQQMNLKSLSTRNVRQRQGRYTSFWGLVTSNYYHFIESLFRLHSLITVVGDEPLTVLMPSLTPQFGRDYLQLVLPASWQVEYVDTLGWIQAESFVFASYATSSSITLPPLAAIQTLRQAMFNAANITEPAEPQRRLYIARQPNQLRRILNEEAVLAVLADYAFEIVRPEELSLVAQVRLFHEAAIVVGAHGAGFANLIYSNKLTMLEFMPQRIFKLYYYTLATVMGHEWHYLRSTVNAPDDGIEVDIAALREKLAAIVDV